jgi:hypothetical protein
LRDEHRELERIAKTELRKVFRGGQRHEDVPALQRPLETRIGMTGRARGSSFRGAGVASLERRSRGEGSLERSEGSKTPRA